MHCLRFLFSLPVSDAFLSTFLMPCSRSPLSLLVLTPSPHNRFSFPSHDFVTFRARFSLLPVSFPSFFRFLSFFFSASFYFFYQFSIFVVFSWPYDSVTTHTRNFSPLLPSFLLPSCYFSFFTILFLVYLFLLILPTILVRTYASLLFLLPLSLFSLSVVFFLLLPLFLFISFASSSFSFLVFYSHSFIIAHTTLRFFPFSPSLLPPSSPPPRPSPARGMNS